MKVETLYVKADGTYEIREIEFIEPTESIPEPEAQPTVWDELATAYTEGVNSI